MDGHESNESTLISGKAGDLSQHPVDVSAGKLIVWQEKDNSLYTEIHEVVKIKPARKVLDSSFRIVRLIGDELHHVEKELRRVLWWISWFFRCTAGSQY